MTGRARRQQRKRARAGARRELDEPCRWGTFSNATSSEPLTLAILAEIMGRLPPRRHGDYERFGIVIDPPRYLPSWVVRGIIS